MKDLTQLYLQRVEDSYAEMSKNETTKKLFNVVAGSSGEISSTEGRAVTSGILANSLRIKDGMCQEVKNTSQRISDARIADAGAGAGVQTVQANMGPWVPETWPLVTAWYSEFPLKDLVSVQNMEKSLDYMFFSKLKTATNKSTTSIGGLIDTPVGKRTIDGRYPTGEVYGESIAAADFDDNETVVAYWPLLVDDDSQEKTSIEVFTAGSTTVPAATLNIDSLSNGTYQLTDGVATPVFSAALDASNGVLTLGGTGVATIVSVKVNYVWNLDYATEETIPQVTEDIEMVPMIAKPRAIAMKWTLFAEYLKKSQFGVDIREENSKRVLSAMYQFQLRYILDTMYKFGTTSGVAIKSKISGSYSMEVFSQQFMQQLNTLSTTIENNSGRIEGNRIVVGVQGKNFFQSMPKTVFEPTAHNDSEGMLSPRELGQYGKYKIYYDPEMESGAGMMTYRGSEWYDAAYYLGMFMPIIPTDAIAIAVNVREAFCSMEAHKFHKKNCVQKFTFDFTTAPSE